MLGSQGGDWPGHGGDYSEKRKEEMIDYRSGSLGEESVDFMFLN